MVTQMKVAQINVTYGNADSTGRNVKELHEYLLDKGIHSCVYTSKVNDDTKIDKEICLFSSAADKKTHALLSRLTGLQGYFSIASTKKLVRKLSEEQPDAVILHVLHSNCINFPILCRYLAENDIPTVLVLHDCWYFTGHCCHFAQNECAKWQQDCRCCQHIHEWNCSWFFDTAHKCLRDKQKWFGSIPRLGVVGVSDWITSEAKKSILKNAASIQRIYNWIDLEIFRPQDTKDLRAELSIREDEKVLLGVASGWSDRKGLQEMLLVAKTIPDCRVIMIGIMPPNIDVPSNMLCTGTIREPKLLTRYYALADVFLNPSIQETFGKTTAEALACGTPVVAYKTTACTELVGCTRGEAVEQVDKNAFVSAVKKVLQQKWNNNQLRSFAEQNFNKNCNIEEYIRMIHSLKRKNHYENRACIKLSESAHETTM